MNLNKIKTMVGFAVKSNNILFGVDNIEASRKPIYLIMADTSLSERTRAVIEKTAQSKKTKLLIITEKLEDVVCKTNCKVIAILDKNMSENIIINACHGGGNLIG